MLLVTRPGPMDAMNSQCQSGQCQCFLLFLGLRHHERVKRVSLLRKARLAHSSRTERHIALNITSNTRRRVHLAANNCGENFRTPSAGSARLWIFLRVPYRVAEHDEHQSRIDSLSDNGREYHVCITRPEKRYLPRTVPSSNRRYNQSCAAQSRLCQSHMR